MGVEHPLEEYKAAYQQHLQRQASDSSKVNCTADQRSRCDKTWQEGWTLRKDNEADEEKCQPVDGIETESVFYSLPDNPCCEYHGCVVRDCIDLRKQWKYDGNKTCTEDDTPNGAEAVCKEECETVHSNECGTRKKSCKTKPCKQAGKCHYEYKVGAMRMMDKCDCPVLKPNPCPANEEQQCREDHKLVEGFDECDCKTKVHVRCEKPDVSQCNSTCHDLKETYSGCCKEYTCERKACPKVEKPKCDKCEELTVEDDECGCCKPVCVRRKCPAVPQCGRGEVAVTFPDTCGCQIFLRCDPREGHPSVSIIGGRFVPYYLCSANPNPKNQCKALENPVELCTVHGC